MYACIEHTAINKHTRKSIGTHQSWPALTYYSGEKRLQGKTAMAIKRRKLCDIHILFRSGNMRESKSVLKEMERRGFFMMYWVTCILLQHFFSRSIWKREVKDEVIYSSLKFQMTPIFICKKKQKTCWWCCDSTVPQAKNDKWDRVITDIWAVKSGDHCGAMG